MTRVIKVGGRPQADVSLPQRIARSWAGDRSAGGTILVHGGGDEVSALQKALGVEARFVDGRRVTSAGDIEIVRMALSGSANKRLVAALHGAGIQAIGLSGEDGGLIVAAPVDPDRLGHVGAPRRINVVLLRLLLDGGYLPVVSPVSQNINGTLGPALNVNGDDAAAALAVAIGASELLLVSDVIGVMHDGALVPRLSQSGANRILADGTAAGGMRAKVEAALSALDGGVPRVRISDLAAIDDLERGTVLMRTTGGLS